MITRVRIEANGRNQTEVHDELLVSVSAIRTTEGGEWEHAEQFQTTKSGWWGSMTITKKTEEGDSNGGT